ncbi:phospholipid carrier-dependent glycosyltransferase [Sinimarinibacterium sp. NLF-5-8]|uniref:phospholipid carrier-dependent glycosyltransferase n=1 Tax=Sinimarinibacterium sp. NLF-5-8 TaxID=2698684 RepID=UPI00137C1A11|nr:phospholipid carrier-dependent glycosyltransferase [Sinimarinibacterium sp. NLF-5-8]QHS08931.1 phospholipid carrier-dependent glycosyltransferase [Sinimarinibacterium sp. NLF-5-8]
MDTASFISLYGLGFVLFATALVQRSGASAKVGASVGADTFTFSRHQWLIWLAVGLALRLPLLWQDGFFYDTGTYKAWALAASNPADPLNLYKEGYFADYPPFYMYVLGALGAIARALDWSTSPHFTALIKLPALLCDLATSLLLYKHLRAELGARQGWTLASLYWFNPALIFTGALWGQTESLLCLLITASWLTWRQGRVLWTALILAVAVSFKPQGALYAGLFGIAMFCCGNWRQIAGSLIVGLLSFAVIVFQFARTREWDWILSLYMSTAATYDYITVNAYNLWALLGWNWQKDVGAPLGVTAQTWALGSTALALIALALWLGMALRKAGDARARGNAIAWAFALGTIVFFMFAPRMHERYILMVLPTLLLVLPTRARMPLLLAWTAGALANIGYVYHYYVDLKQVAPFDTPFMRIASGYNLALTLLTLLTWRAPQWPQALRQRLPAWPWPQWFAVPTELDPITGARAPQRALIISGFTLTALALGLFHLGHGPALYPHSGVVSDGMTLEYVYQHPVSARALLLHTGEKAPYDNKVTLQIERYSDDGQWHTVLAEKEFPDFFRFYDQELENPAPSARYRIKTGGLGWRINELGLVDADSNLLLPDHITVEYPQELDARALIDEPHTLLRKQGFLSSTYFDEIYHGRTAYEFLHRLPIYETTHPPLGKWLISVGIDAFGMNPFGWRFMGVVASALTVGVLAWGGWLLSGGARTGLWLGGALGLFEFSRFTLGRYATIDAFLGLFLLLSTLFLWRAFCGARAQAFSDWRDGWRLSASLLAAGAFLGAAIATKWSALYGGIGVFVFAVVSLASGLFRAPRWTAFGARALGAAVAFGLLPLVIYVFSYTPFVRCLQNAPSLLSHDGLQAVLQSQRDIYNYHSQLVDNHPFSSRFWTWPLDLKPMWIFTGVDTPRTSITIMGNPLLWWSALVLLISLCWHNLRAPKLRELLLLGAIASLYLPWAFIGRTTFIYHYYPAALILLPMLAAKITDISRIPRWRELPGYTALTAGVLFVWFYPSISGMPAADAWFKSLRWFATWWML